MLAARIRAQVRIGQTIELLSDSTTNPTLKHGDLGRVSGFSPEGNVVVTWDDGFVAILDPENEHWSISEAPSP